MSELGLTAVPLPRLQGLLEAVEAGRLACPLTRTGLLAGGFAALVNDSGVRDLLAGLEAPAVAAVLRVALAERARPTPTLDLVWTGPEGRAATSRDTAVVVRQLFRGARRSVHVAGFWFDHGASILRPLYEAMVQHGVEASLYLDIRGEARGTSACSDRDRLVRPERRLRGHRGRVQTIRGSGHRGCGPGAGRFHG